MQHDRIIFQLAPHYLSKIALRLERLFLAIGQARHETHPIIHHYAIKNIIEIIKLIEKPELKSRFIKELMRMEHLLNKSQGRITHAVYASLFVQVQILNHMAGRFGETIHQDLFLQSIQLTHPKHSGDCELDSPQLLLWLENDASRRQSDIETWLMHLRTLEDTVTVYLSLLRNTAEFETIALLNGFYQRSLPAKPACQLIMLRMDTHCGLVPKMQFGHHGLTLRLCEAMSMLEVAHENTTVDLAICQI
ncbi:MAG TPA: cell division protein ZapD [Legionella sp.]|nr:cell division protein ZapD [Legionella sp.]